MPRSLAIRSMLAGESEFMRAGNNEALINAHCGGGSRNKPDAATWDAASTRYGVRCETWHEAFRACCGPAPRSWATFDLETLRACIPGLDLPAWVYEAQAEAAEREMARGLDELALAEQEAWYADGGGLDEEEAGEVLVVVDEEMIEGEALVLPSWRRAA